MIKILQLIKSLGRGGAETLLPETIKLHNQKQFEFHVIYFLPWKDQMVESIQQAGAKVDCLNKKNNWQIITSVNEIQEFCWENKIDLIHAHLPWAGMLARRIGRTTGIPVIYTEHNKQERYHILTRWINRITFNQQQLAIAVSEDVEHSIGKNINPGIEVKTILNGVNTQKYDPQDFVKSRSRSELGIPQNSIVIGAVAVFRKQKRLDLWVEVASKTMTKYPETFFVILGDGPEEEAVRWKLETRSLQDFALLPGRLEEVRPWLAAMDVFMMTSEFEGLPIALLEAMSMELPVVATDAGGIKEVVRDGVEGFLKPVDQPMDLEIPLSKLIEDENLRIEMGKRGRVRVKEAFSMERMVRELEETYVEVHNNAKARRR